MSKSLIDSAGAVRAGEELDLAKVSAYLRAQGLSLDGEPVLTQFPGGASNLTYQLTYANCDLILRRPPFGHIAKSAHDVVREARIMKALRPVYPVVPVIHAICEDLAVIGAPGADWVSQRDKLLLALLYNTGARVSEAIGVKVGDVVLAPAACVHLHGKGRKQRSVPLWRSTVKVIRAWLKFNPDLTSTSALLPNRGGQAMTRSNVTQRLALAVKAAALKTPSLAGRTISPHCLRHSTAMHLLQSGVDITVIALWLGHESPATTHQYVEADLAMKEKALARLQDPNVVPQRFRADDDLLKFLKRSGIVVLLIHYFQFF